MSAQATVEQIIAPDGTPLACHRSGTDPPLLLVHGTRGDHTRWAEQRPVEARREWRQRKHYRDWVGYSPLRK